MSKFIKLTIYDRDTSILVRDEHISAVEPNMPLGSMVHLLNGQSYLVKEAFADPCLADDVFGNFTRREVAPGEYVIETYG